LRDHAQRILKHLSTVRANTTSDDVPRWRSSFRGGGQLSAMRRILVAATKLSAAEVNDGPTAEPTAKPAPAGFDPAAG
jgi:hypothetical protein